MDMVDAIEKGETLGNCSLQFLYVILWVVGLSVIGGIVTKKRMNKGVY